MEDEELDHKFDVLAAEVHFIAQRIRRHVSQQYKVHRLLQLNRNRKSKRLHVIDYFDKEILAFFKDEETEERENKLAQNKWAREQVQNESTSAKESADNTTENEESAESPAESRSEPKKVTDDRSEDQQQRSV